MFLHFNSFNSQSLLIYTFNFTYVLNLKQQNKKNKRLETFVHRSVPVNGELSISFHSLLLYMHEGKGVRILLPRAQRSPQGNNYRTEKNSLSSIALEKGNNSQLDRRSGT